MNGGKCANYGQKHCCKCHGHLVLWQAQAEAPNWQVTPGTRPTRRTMPAAPPPGERTALGHPSTAGRKRSATSEPLPHEGKKRPPKQIWKEEQRKEPFGVVDRKMLTYLPYTKKAVDFMQRTRLLKQYQGVSWE